MFFAFVRQHKTGTAGMHRLPSTALGVQIFGRAATSDAAAAWTARSDAPADRDAGWRPGRRSARLRLGDGRRSIPAHRRNPSHPRKNSRPHGPRSRRKPRRAPESRDSPEAPPYNATHHATAPTDATNMPKYRVRSARLLGGRPPDRLQRT
ncbi:hypothetical protein JCM9534A_13940 [Catenuloplanes indicus JCM 9534]